MGRGGAGLGRRAVADRRAAGDQARPVGVLGVGERRLDRRRIVAVDPLDPPAIGREALQLIARRRQIGRAVDRDVVVVEQDDQPVEPLMPGELAGLVADPLHQVAVARERVGAVVDQLRAEAGAQVAFGERHADRVREPLAERPGGGLDAGRMAVFRMARGARAELAEALQLLDVHGRIAGQMEQRVEQHRAVARRQHEAIAIGPVGRARRRSAGTCRTAPSRRRPCPSACPDGRSWRPARRPWRAPGSHWRGHDGPRATRAGPARRGRRSGRLS